MSVEQHVPANCPYFLLKTEERLGMQEEIVVGNGLKAAVADMQALMTDLQDLGPLVQEVKIILHTFKRLWQGFKLVAKGTLIVGAPIGTALGILNGLGVI